MLGWLILIFLPRRWGWLVAIPRFVIPFGLSLLYAGLAMTRFFQIEGGGYGSLDEVAVASPGVVPVAGLYARCVEDLDKRNIMSFQDLPFFLCKCSMKSQ